MQEGDVEARSLDRGFVFGSVPWRLRVRPGQGSVTEVVEAAVQKSDQALQKLLPVGDLRVALRARTAQLGRQNGDTAQNLPGSAPSWVKVTSLPTPRERAPCD